MVKKREMKKLFSLFFVLLSSFLLPCPLSFSYTSRHMRRYLFVLDNMYFPRSSCSLLEHWLVTMGDAGEEIVHLTCSFILKSYASRLIGSTLWFYLAACARRLLLAWWNSALLCLCPFYWFFSFCGERTYLFRWGRLSASLIFWMKVCLDAFRLHVLLFVACI